MSLTVPEDSAISPRKEPEDVPPQVGLAEKLREYILVASTNVFTYSSLVSRKNGEKVCERRYVLQVLPR